MIERKKVSSCCDDKNAKEYDFILRTYLTETIVSDVNFPNTLGMLLELDNKTPILEYLRDKIDALRFEYDLRSTCSALLNVFITGLQKYADNKRLRYVL